MPISSGAFTEVSPTFGVASRLAVATTLCVALVCAQQARAGSAKDSPETAWQPGAIGHSHAMRAFRDADSASQPTPPVILKFAIDFDPSGQIATQQMHGATPTARNPFFQSLGTNDRTCFTCHQPQTGWSVSAASVQARFYTSGGADPIFRLVDGATCPSDDVSSPSAKLDAYSLLLDRGLLRIGLSREIGMRKSRPS
jgi:hypothetical protein